jgi:hypothetical protein
MMSYRKGILMLACGFVCQAAEPAAGRWEGAIRIPGRELRLVIDLAQDGQGRWTGSAILPDLGIKGAPLSDLSVNAADIAFTLAGVLGDPQLRGRLDAGGSFAGDYTQAGNTAPFTLQRAGLAQVDPPRQSTAVDKALEGDWEGDLTFVGNPLHVRLSLSNQAGGAATGKLVAVGKRETVLPAHLVTEHAGFLELELENGYTFEGRFRSAAKEIAGTFTAGPYEAAVTLHPAAKAGVERP